MAKKKNRPSTPAVAANGEVEPPIPRPRHGRVVPALVRKYRRRFPGFDEKIIALYGRGMSIGDIQRQVREIYAIDISADLVSVVTDSVLDEVTVWQARPLETSYAIVFFDALWVTVRDKGSIKNKAVYLALGIRPSGYKQVLGLWIEQSEDATFWMRVMSDLRARGTQDILIAVADGLKGFQEAVSAVFPKTVVQTCIVHLMRYSLQIVSWGERTRLANALRYIYYARSAEGAAVALELFALDGLGRKYPVIAESWRRNWEAIIPFFALPDEVRRIIYTSHAIESLNASLRRAIRNNGNLPNDQAATKLIWLALRNVAENWQNRPQSWRTAAVQLAVRFQGRFVEEE